jgi:hypothetical protein
MVTTSLRFVLEDGPIVSIWIAAFPVDRRWARVLDVHTVALTLGVLTQHPYRRTHVSVAYRNNACAVS